MSKYIYTFLILCFTSLAHAQVNTNNGFEFKLVSFKAIPQIDRSIVLAWTTEKEVGTFMFQVERSVDNISFSSLAQIPAAGNSDIYKSYSFKDHTNPDGDLFYRLKMITADNNTEISQSVSLNITDSDSLLVFTNVFPQPATNSFNIEFKSNREVPLTLRILDIMGKSMYETELNPTVIPKILTFDISDWQKGTYFVQVFNWQHHSLHKVMVQ